MILPPAMKTPFCLPLGLILVSTALLAQPAAPPPATDATKAPAGPRTQRPPSPPGVDNFYKLSPDSLRMDGVPRGKFTDGKIIPSQIFPGTQHTYYVYVPAQYDPSKPTALMVFCDGQAMMAEPGGVQGHVVLDNLIYRGELPVMLGVFINPGRRPDQPEPSAAGWGDRTANRKEEYDTPNEKFARVLVEELMPALKKDFNVSPDPEMHGIMGTSSGGIAARFSPR